MFNGGFKTLASMASKAYVATELAKERIGDVTGDLTGTLKTNTTWAEGITGGAIQIGDYSTPVAFGTVTDNLLGAVVSLSGNTTDSQNIIPIHGKVVTTAHSGAGGTAQSIYGRVDIAHDLPSSYAIRGAITITGAGSVDAGPEVNQAYSLFGTLAVAKCNLATTGYLAGAAIEISGTEDVTQTGGGHGKVCGIRVAWGQTNAMTVETCGMHIAIAAGATLDSGYRVNASGTLTNAFHSKNTTSTPTNGLKLEGAHTNAFAFPALSTAPVSEQVNADIVFAHYAKIAITIAGVAYSLIAEKV